MFESILDKFDCSWENGQQPSIGTFLNSASLPNNERLKLLTELICIDLEYRWQNDSEKVSRFKVEDYLSRWPDLDDQDDLVFQIVAEEIRAIRRAGVRPDRVDFENRFGSKKKLWNLIAKAFSHNTLDHEEKAGLPPQIHGYQIVHRLGEGGMGEVWLADELGSVKRRVALKVIRSNVKGTEVVSRFEAERQAIALMNHPNIAGFYHAGITAEGSPFFSMEYVDGQPINEYCDASKASIDDRIELVAEVALGVQHAHQKGVIHRDLKPSNVLVVEIDGKPVPKIIDFGLAKAVSPLVSLTDETLLTEFQAVLGTLTYMSPEQADTHSSDVDTRADIYSLGVLLYELLAGSPPLRTEDIRNSSLLNVLRQIQDSNPPSPSNRLSDSSSDLNQISSDRGTTPIVIQRKIRGDLDWVVMKSIEKDRNRRYSTAKELSDDLLRYLKRDPVRARPPSMAYVLKRFVIKHRTAVSMVALLLISIVVGLSSSIHFALKFRHESEVANAAAIKESKAKDKAAREAENSKKLLLAWRRTDRLFDRLTIDPYASTAAGVITANVANQWQELYGGIAALALENEDLWSVRSQSLYRQAFLCGRIRSAKYCAELLEQSLSIQNAHDDSYLKAKTLRELGYFYFLQQRFGDSIQHHRQAIRVFESLKQDNFISQRLPLELAISHNLLGEPLMATGQHQPGMKAFSLSLELLQNLKTKNEKELKLDGLWYECLYFEAMVHMNLGIAHMQMNASELAGEHFETAILSLEDLINSAPNTTKYRQRLGRARLNLAFRFQLDGKPRMAIQEARKSVAIFSDLKQELYSNFETYQDCLGAYLNLIAFQLASGEPESAKENVQKLNEMLDRHPEYFPNQELNTNLQHRIQLFRRQFDNGK